MAAVTRAFKGMSTLNPPPNCQHTAPAATALSAGDMVYINSSGQFAKADGTANDALAVWWGIVLQDVASGEPATAYHSVQVRYGSGLTPGARYYVATTAGGLDTAATTGGTVACAQAVDAYNVFIRPPAK